MWIRLSTATVTCGAAMLITAGAAAQPHEMWTERWDGPESLEELTYNVAIDAESNVFACGYTQSAVGGYDFFIAKFDRFGRHQWSQIYDGPASGEDIAVAAVVDGAGAVIVTGWSDGGATGYDYALVKYDADGNLVWVNRYEGGMNGPDYTGANCLDVDANGDIVVTGYSGNTSGGWDAVTLRYAADGSMLWERRYTSPSAVPFALGYTLMLDSTGAALVGADARDVNNNRDAVVLKYERDGALAWDTWYDSPYELADSAYDIAVDSDGASYVAIASQGATTHYDYRAIKLDSAGAVLWDNSYDGGAVDYPFAITVDAIGQSYVTGQMMTHSGEIAIGTIKFLGDGTIDWAQRYSHPIWFAPDIGSDIVVNDAGECYVVGRSWGGPSRGFDLVALGYDPDGIQIMESIFDGAAHGDDGASAIAIDGRGDLYVAGFSLGLGTAADVLVKRFRAAPEPTLSITPDPLQGGQAATFTVADADPNADIYLAYSVVGVGEGPYVPFLNVTLDLLAPQQAGEVTQTDAQGFAQWTLLIPNAAVGSDVWLQAAHQRLATNVVATSVE